jgi:Uma2 family endonuclease
MYFGGGINHRLQSRSEAVRSERIAMNQALILPKNADRQLVYAGITWQQFKLIQAGFADAPGIRLSYFDRTIEILMPGRTHELFKSMIGMLVELFCLEMGVEFEPMGSMTHERDGEVALEADESYCFGISKAIPDLAIEVVLTSGSSDKLQRYQLLGVSEVWFWQDGVFSLYHLREREYAPIIRSEIPDLAALDIDLLARCVLMAEISRLNAAKEFRQQILKSI